MGGAAAGMDVQGGCFRQGSGTSLRWGGAQGRWMVWVFGWCDWRAGGGDEKCKLCSGGAGQVYRVSISVHMH